MRSAPLTVGLFAALALSAGVSAQPDLGTDAQRETGKVAYQKYCSQCHGDQGDGQGIAASYLLPPPRDFRQGKYKIRSTPNGTLPADSDIARAIRLGLPGTGMPAFDTLSAGEITGLVQYLKTFSSDFEDPDAYAPPLELPAAPPYTLENAEVGRQLYKTTGCGQCHGNEGRGDGASAPTQRDDWGSFIRVADLTMPWTFRGGATREDVFRAISSGLNGTPMAGFEAGLSIEERWRMVDFIASLSGNRTEAPYSNLVTATGHDGALDLALGDELFAAAPEAMFPIVGQIMQPGRNFYPSARAVKVQAVYNQDEIAFRLSWNDLSAEQSGQNTPDLEVPSFDEERAATAGAQSGSGEAGETGEDDSGGFWGEEEEGDEGDTGSIWGDAAVGEDSDADSGGDDFWGDGDDAFAAETAAAVPVSEFSDAIALQFPRTLPTGIRLPYFLFGDAQNPVELWHVDLASRQSLVYVGRGSDNVAPAEGGEPEIVASYAAGEWSVTFKRQRISRSGISFPEGSFVPFALSTWDGFNRERGNKRGLTGWYNVYLEPIERPSPWADMAKAGFSVLILELLVIGLVRRRKRGPARAVSSSTERKVHV